MGQTAVNGTNRLQLGKSVLRKCLKRRAKLVGRRGFEPRANWLKANARKSAFARAINNMAAAFVPFIQSAYLKNSREIRGFNLALGQDFTRSAGTGRPLSTNRRNTAWHSQK